MNHLKKNHKFSQENTKSVDHICKEHQMTTNTFKTRFYNAIMQYYDAVNNTTDEKATKNAIAEIRQLFVETVSTTVAVDGFSSYIIAAVDGIASAIHSGIDRAADALSLAHGIFSVTPYLGFPIAAVVLPLTWGVEFSFWFYLLKKNRITKQELWFRATKAALRIGGAFGAGVGGMVFGTCVAIGVVGSVL